MRSYFLLLSLILPHALAGQNGELDDHIQDSDGMDSYAGQERSGASSGGSHRLVKRGRERGSAELGTSAEQDV
jgi:hypothetical protein